MTTVGSSIQVLYRDRLEYLRAHGFDITVVCAPSELDTAIRARGVRLWTAPLTRAITPATDLRALWTITGFLRRERFDLVEVGTPKAALVGSLAAHLAGTRPIVHILHGLAYEGKSGLSGRLVRWSTGVPCRLANVTLAVSPSARAQAISDGLVQPERIRVLGAGSCNGVDLARFHPDRRTAGAQIRAQLGIRSPTVTLAFLGRFTRDKGLGELVAAARHLEQRGREFTLLMVGDYEAHDRPPAEVIEYLSTSPRVHHVGWQADPVPYLAAADVIVLPSYREGLGMVLLEAAALGLPVVTTTATGCCDAVRPGETGLCVPPHDVPALTAALEQMIADAALRTRLGAAGRVWVAQNFDQRQVWDAWMNCYRELLSRQRSGLDH